MPRYNPAEIEPKWQKYWEAQKTFASPRLPKDRKLYVLDMFPYPSGDGLHVGHPEGYTATDIVCRYSRMKGYSVMHPMGWDAFGLPAEQHAKKTGEHPRLTTEKNIANFRRQLKMLGFSYDWDRELATTDLDYFRWTQYIFLVLFDTWYDVARQRGRPIAELPIPPEVAAAGEDAIERYRDEHRLAYQLEAPVNWCPALGTVLANEEVVGGVSERGGHPVVRTRLRQWMLRITAYADRLEKDLDQLDWPENIKLLQRNWIGRSHGTEVDFYLGPPQSAAEYKKNPAGKLEVLKKGFATWKQSRARSGFPKKPGDDVLRVFTTRPDTLYGATYMVIAPEHPFVERLTTPGQALVVKDYCLQAARKSDLDRTDLARQKTGVFTGSYAINPVNEEAIPVWVADYVLIGYGTGAIMAVPAHDTRDFEFARQYRLPIRWVVAPPAGTIDASSEEAFIEDGIAINSAEYTGLTTAEFKRKITEDLSAKGLARPAVNYKLRDWLFSRQHFWGEPFPILHELDDAGQPTGRIRALEPSELPLDLPEKVSYEAVHNRPVPPLESAPPEWLFVVRDGKRYKRETNTMPQWAGSCWYYLRFLDPHNDKAFVDPEVERAWMPVDLYVGGAEHAVLHLLYARFWHKVLYDRGYVSTEEPFQKLVNQGMILGELEFTGYRTSDDRWLSATDVEEIASERFVSKHDGAVVQPVKLKLEEVVKQGDCFVLREAPQIRVESRAYKMSKSRGNVVNPDYVVAEYGADALRLYEMFLGPLEAVKPWSMEGVNGVRGFLERVWRMLIDERAEVILLNAAVKDTPLTEEQNRLLHKTIKAVTTDIEQLSFNTAIARMMELVNFFLKQDVRPREAMEKFVLLLSPFAPHIAEELWAALGHKHTLAYEPWPTWDEVALRETQIEVPVQINGKLRGRVCVAADSSTAELEAAARNEPRIAALLTGKQIKKTIVVPGRMVNFVVQ